MENKQLSILDLIVENHVGLERQGPGSPEMTVKALSFIDNLTDNLQILDLGCGTGGQTMVLAQHVPGNITGIDLFPQFIDLFNANAARLNLQDRVKGILGSMDNLPFGNEGFDLIWSEGAIYNIGFERGLNEWRKFLKSGGYIAVTEVSWLIDKRPAEIENFWNENYPEIDTIPNKVVQMQEAGYIPVAIFVLPAKCWTDNYYIPREAALKMLLDKYTGNKTVEAFVESNRYEVELYSKYRQYYGYVFYIGKKVSIYKKERN